MVRRVRAAPCPVNLVERDCVQQAPRRLAGLPLRLRLSRHAGRARAQTCNSCRQVRSAHLSLFIPVRHDHLPNGLGLGALVVYVCCRLLCALAVLEAQCAQPHTSPSRRAALHAAYHMRLLYAPSRLGAAPPPAGWPSGPGPWLFCPRGLSSPLRLARRAWPRACPQARTHSRHLPLLCQEHRSHLRGPCALEWHEPARRGRLLLPPHPTVRASGTAGEPCGAPAPCVGLVRVKRRRHLVVWAVSALCSASSRGSRVVTTHGWLPRLCVGRLPCPSPRCTALRRRPVCAVWVLRVAYRWHAFLTCLGQ